MAKQRNSTIKAVDYQAPSEIKPTVKFHLTSGHWVLILLVLACILFILFITLARSIQISVVSSVNADSVPSQTLAADVNLASWIKLPVGKRLLVLPGTHSVDVAAKGFQSLQTTLDINRGQSQMFKIQLEPLPGKLDITLSPQVSAQVLMQGEVIGMLPGLLEDISPGQQQLTIDAHLYRPNTQTILIQGQDITQELAVELQPAWAELTVNSKPMGGTVFIDGQEVGRTPLTTKVEEGSRKLQIRLEKFKPHEQEIIVEAEKDILLPPPTLLPEDGVLEVTTVPNAAALIVDGEYIGVSPIKLDLTPNSNHEIQVYKAGFRRQTKTVKLASNQHSAESFRLVEDLVKVKFSITPSDAELYIDGRKRGVGSQTLSLNTLSHKVSIKKPGFVSYQIELVPTKSNEQVVSVKLLTVEQHFWANIPDIYTSKAGQIMQLFKAGVTVKMGSSRREVGRRANEVVYSAQLNKHFYVSQKEVTNKQFRLFDATHTGGNYKGKSLDSGQHPVVNISWQRAAQYCNWLSNKEGLKLFYQTESGFVSGVNRQAQGYRLLTEVEWAWLARNKTVAGKTQTITYPWGNQDVVPKGTPVENLADENARNILAFTLDNYDDGYAASSPVGKYPANDKGIFDIGGNASEWVNDWYDASANLNSIKSGNLSDPLGPEIGEFHVVRGASWAKGHLPQIRLAYRDFAAKGRHDIGFRIARYVGSPQ